MQYLNRLDSLKNSVYKSINCIVIIISGNAIKLSLKNESVHSIFNKLSATIIM